MKKYIHVNGEEIRYFENDVDVSAWIDLNKYRLMTQEEVDRHENPEKYMTEKELKQVVRQRMPKLSKRQFALYLYDNQMYDQVMQVIEANPRFKIEYDSVSDIERLSPTVSEMTVLLDWTDEQVDQMWEEALTL